MAEIRRGPLVKGVVIEPGRGREIRRDLTLWYDMGAMGRYMVTAEIAWDGRIMASRPVVLEVVRGIELQQVSRGVRGYPNLKRTYSLRYWPREGAEQLFLSVDESPTGLNYGVFRLGPVVRVFKPVVEVDGQGKIVVVHQSTSRRFVRSVLKGSRERIYFEGQSVHVPEPSSREPPDDELVEGEDRQGRERE